MNYKLKNNIINTKKYKQKYKKTKYKKTKYKKTKYILRGGSKSICSYLKRINEIIKLMTISSNNSSNIKLFDNSDIDNRKEQIQIISNELKNNFLIYNLYLINNKINDDELQILVNGLKYNTYITTLNISNNNLTDKSAQILIELLKTNITIDDIILTHNNIQDKNKYFINQILYTRNRIENLFFPKLDLLPNLTDNLDIKIIENKIECMKELIVFNEESGMTFDNKIKILFNINNINNNNFNKLIKNNYDSGTNKIKTLDTLNLDNIVIEVDLHGVCLTKIFKLPKNVNIVFLSPVSYITCSNSVMVHKYLESKLENFLKNPSCFNKKYFSQVFSEAVIYYGGQYCMNTKLERDPVDHVTGIHIYETNSKTFKNTEQLFKDNLIVDDNLIPLENLSKDKYSNYLDKFLLKYFSNNNNKNKTFTLFFTSCRELTEQRNKNYLVFYEQTIKILNSIIFYEYINNNMNKITDITKYKDYYNNDCMGNITDFQFGFDEGHISHVQYNKTNNIHFKINNLKSSKKTIIADTSKIYINDPILNIFSGKHLQYELFNIDKLKKNEENDKFYVEIIDIIKYIISNKNKINIIYGELYRLFLKNGSWNIISESKSKLFFGKKNFTHFNLIKYILKPKLFIGFIFYYLNIDKTLTNDIYMKLLDIFIKNVSEINTIDEIIINDPIKYEGFTIILNILKNNKNVVNLDLQNTNLTDKNITDLLEFVNLKLYKSKEQGPILLQEMHKFNLKKLNLKNNTFSDENKKILNATRIGNIPNYLKDKEIIEILTD